MMMLCCRPFSVLDALRKAHLKGYHWHVQQVLDIEGYTTKVESLLVIVASTAQCLAGLHVACSCIIAYCLLCHGPQYLIYQEAVSFNEYEALLDCITELLLLLT